MDEREASAASIFLLSKAGTKLKPVMEMAGFSKVEIENLTLQQRIRRLITKKRQDPGIPPPPSVILVSSSTSLASTLGPAGPSTADHSSEYYAHAFIAMLEAEKSICVYSNPSKLNVNQLKVLVKWKYASKKIPTRKDELLAAWNDTMRSEPENLPEQWTNSDEDKLGRLQNDEIKIKDTELGRQANRVVMDLQSAIPLLSTPQRKVLRNSLGSSGPTNT
jgi:hypothetical protein